MGNYLRRTMSNCKTWPSIFRRGWHLLDGLYPGEGLFNIDPWRKELRHERSSARMGNGMSEPRPGEIAGQADREVQSRQVGWSEIRDESVTGVPWERYAPRGRGLLQSLF